MYATAGPEGTPADTGMQIGHELYDAELAARTKFTDPLVGRRESAQPAGGMAAVRFRPDQALEYYN